MKLNRETRAVRYVVVVLCLLVVLFSVQAKVFAYQPFADQAKDVSCSKLMPNDHKMGLTAAPDLLWLVALTVALVAPLLLSKPSRVTTSVESLCLSPRRFELHRFLRPPPSI
jgi:hypothetical protein